ncbi:Phosphopentomutase [Candidatus Providencia siddallii]|uniref:Phosphopentomutase n=1 Tax=Candidatus Providencia siddallii TaxID=1715285 RepID=A0A0M6W7E0_9GAMM|nr:Phosphopentomutase [Candidatus Providencia siddallii]
MRRLFIIVLDSLGIGSSEDSYKFGDNGSNTLGHIAESCFFGDISDHSKYLYIPNLTKLGLGKAAEEASGSFPLGLDYKTKIIGAYAYASAVSSGKDTPSGHWELAGVPVLFNWGYFLDKKNSFPKKLLDILIKKANLFGFLGNCHSSGTVILSKLGEEHIKTCKPIFYTSADSVFQIACHEDIYGLNKLYELCKIVRNELTEGNYNICRVIARPFIGNNAKNFIRTGNRYDLAMPPPGRTVLKKIIDEKNGKVISIGKISDIYANIGITKTIKATGINSLFDETVKEIKNASNNTIVFSNFVDFDSLYGHRRDAAGYAKALELFDYRLPEILGLVKSGDILILTSDHGCDPTWYGTEHTREYIPVLIYGPDIIPKNLGYRKTFADIGQTIAEYFSLSPMEYGISML